MLAHCHPANSPHFTKGREMRWKVYNKGKAGVRPLSCWDSSESNRNIIHLAFIYASQMEHSAPKMDDSAWESWLRSLRQLIEPWCENRNVLKNPKFQLFSNHFGSNVVLILRLTSPVTSSAEAVDWQRHPLPDTYLIHDDARQKKCVQKVKNPWQHLVKLPLNTREGTHFTLNPMLGF